MRRQDKSKPSAATMQVAEKAAESGSSAAVKHTSEMRNGLVLLCIAIVSAAIAMMLFAHAGASLILSAVGGAGAWTALMLVHKHVQKSARIAQLEAELARVRAGDMKGKPSRATPAAHEAPAQPMFETRPPDVGLGLRPAEAPLRAAPAEGQADLFVKHPGATETMPVPPIRQPASIDSLIDLHLRPGPELQAPAGGALASESHTASAEPIREQWSFRPRAERREPLPGAPDTSSDAARAGMPSTIEGDLELVQRKIKELADEVNSAITPLPPKPARPEGRPEAQIRATADAIEDSIGALKAAAGSMRDRRSVEIPTTLKIPEAEPPAASAGFGELVIPSTATRIAGSGGSTPTAPTPEVAPPHLDEPPRLELPFPDFPNIELPSAPASAPSLSPRMVAVGQAVESDAMDVFLGPIVTLSAHTVSHYEMTVALKAPNGERLETTDEDFALLGSDVAAQFDVTRLRRAAALSQRMEARDKDGALLTEFSGASLTSRPFLEAFARFYEERSRISAQLVLMFSQRAVAGFTPAAWEAVRDMHAFGFRLALGGVGHMDTDLSALAHSGFRFIRLEAQALLNGVPARDRLVATDEIHQRATLAGLQVIATGISDAKTQARLLASGIMLGQGPLFGAPRQVNLDGVQPRSAAA